MYLLLLEENRLNDTKRIWGCVLKVAQSLKQVESLRDLRVIESACVDGTYSIALVLSRPGYAGFYFTNNVSGYFEAHPNISG